MEHLHFCVMGATDDGTQIVPILYSVLARHIEMSLPAHMPMKWWWVVFFWRVVTLGKTSLLSWPTT